MSTIRKWASPTQTANLAKWLQEQGIRPEQVKAWFLKLKGPYKVRGVNFEYKEVIKCMTQPAQPQVPVATDERYDRLVAQLKSCKLKRDYDAVVASL